MAVRAGIRVDLALRAGDVPRAVHGTVAFFEAALWDHLCGHLERHPEGRRQFRVSPAPPDSLVRSTSLDENENRGRPFDVVATEDDIMWYRIFDDDVCAVRLAKHYLQKCALQKLGQAVSKVRELRNDVAHNEPTPSLMDDARRRMAEAGLWSSRGRFLTQKLIKDVLNELGEEDPENLCESLIATARDGLRDVLTSVKEPRGTGHGSQPDHEPSAGRTR